MNVKTRYAQVFYPRPSSYVGPEMKPGELVSIDGGEEWFHPYDGSRPIPLASLKFANWTVIT